MAEHCSAPSPKARGGIPSSPRSRRLHLGPGFILIDANGAEPALHRELLGGPLAGLRAVGAAKGYGCHQGWAASVTFLGLTSQRPRSWDAPSAAAHGSMGPARHKAERLRLHSVTTVNIDSSAARPSNRRVLSAPGY